MSRDMKEIEFAGLENQLGVEADEEWISKYWIKRQFVQEGLKG